MVENKEETMRLFKNPIVMNLILAAAVCIVLLYGVLHWLDSYTQHNRAIVVPDVKGLPVEEAAVLFENNNLRYNVIDSVFSKNVKPGTVVEVVPAISTKVKEGRILFVTINATTAQMGVVPDVEDHSFRQAYALLKSIGFVTVDTEYVAGDYKDLVVAVKMNGNTLHPGQQIPLSSRLTLIISSGEAEPDSLNIDNPPVEQLDSEDEKWF